MCVCVCVCRAGGWGANYYQALHVLLAPPGSVYLCVGGWIGATSLYAATLPSQPTVWSFEPDPAAFAEVCMCSLIA